MTIEEKRRRLELACVGYEACEGCPLGERVHTGYCYTKSDNPEEDPDIERNYAIMFGNLENEEERTGCAEGVMLVKEYTCGREHKHHLFGLMIVVEGVKIGLLLAIVAGLMRIGGGWA